MSRLTLINLLVYIGALLVAGLAVVVLAHAPEQAQGPTITDAQGLQVQVKRYGRVAALDLVADDLVGELLEPQRIAAVSAWVQGPDAWRHAGRARLPGLTDLEQIIQLKPDLVLISTYGGEQDKFARLREAGIAVFDLGPAGGVAQLTANLRRVGAAVGEPERGERAALRLTRRLAQIAAHLPAGFQRRRALALTPVVDNVYGGSDGSSFHDVLCAAGLIDASSGRYREPWPRIGAEDALALDPDLVITRSGGIADLRRIPGFDRLRALREPGGTIELPNELYDSPGLVMLDAAEELHARAYAAMSLPR